MINLLKQRLPIGTGALILAVSLALSGCNTSTKAVESAGQESTQQQAQADAADAAENGEAEKAEEGGPTIVRQAPKVSQKGTTISAIVNGTPITSVDVRRRMAFLKLRRAKGNHSKLALEEMVDQTLKMQEAARTGSVANDKQVNEAFANFAKGNKLTTSQMTTILGQSGVSAAHFKEFIRTQISWNNVVQGRFRYESTNEVKKDALFNLRKSGGEKPTTTEYRLQQVIFVIPQDKRSNATISRRRQEAIAFKQKFSSCQTTKQASVGLLDVAVKDLQRIFEEQLPPEWMDDVKNTPAGSTTNIKTTEKGVEFLAVCSRRVVSDDDVAELMSQKEQFESFNEKGTELSEKYLKEVKSTARIIYR